MKLTAHTRAAVAMLLTLPVPEDVDLDVWPDRTVMIQARSQDAVRRVQACFPGVLWSESYERVHSWWAYDGVTATGFRMHIYACKEPVVPEMDADGEPIMDTEENNDA